MMCWPWSHKWGKWKTFEVGACLKLTDSLGLPIEDESKRPVTGHYEYQRRECSECGISQIREDRA